MHTYVRFHKTKTERMRKMKMVLLGLSIVLSGIFENVKAGLPYSSTHLSESNTNNNQTTEQKIQTAYRQLDFGNEKPLSYEVFKKGYIGFLNLQQEGMLEKDKDILSIADYSLSANEKRLWVIDLDKHEILFHSLVAHGQGTGDEFAEKFSNQNNSHQSSLGFFITDQTYFGNNGYSLKLQGLDKSYNDNAYARAIVIHGADYVSNSFIQAHKRLGRSWGCPALPKATAESIINTIKGKTCFFAYYPNEKYLASSKWLTRMPNIPGEDLYNDQFKKKTNSRALLAEASIPQQQAASGKEVIQIQQPVYNGVMLNTPDTL